MRIGSPMALMVDAKVTTTERAGSLSNGLDSEGGSG